MKNIFASLAVSLISASCFNPDSSRPGDAAMVEAWENGGRAETLSWFRRNVYGITPVDKPDDMVIGEREVSMAGGRIKIGISLSLPENASAENPVPVFVFGDHSNDQSALPFRKKVYADIPTNAITARGYAYVTFNFNDICPNTARGPFLDEWKKGVYQIYGGADRTADSWGTIAAWAWGFSRVVDWIETRPELDRRRIAVVGHSRGGKTALWAAAQDERIALAVSNNSGCGGAKLNRMKIEKSEHISQILRSFPFWFCLNFARYADADDTVEHDQDDLIRLIAPRLVYVASATKDPWAGPEGEFAAAKKASDLFRAYGKGGISLDRIPEPGRCDHGGAVGYHLREGIHKLTPFDWNMFMDFADRHMRRSASAQGR